MGDTLDEMRKNVGNTALPQAGDAVLMWVNEGDIANGIMQGRVEILSNTKDY